MRLALRRVLSRFSMLGTSETTVATGINSASNVPSPAPGAILDAYVTAPPSPQLAVDLFMGEWSSQLPDFLGVNAGSNLLFDDYRLAWLLKEAGDLTDRRVLELGPLEGGHSFQLGNVGAHVTAIEANTHAYLKCLIVKELLGMITCNFLLGDFVDYLVEHEDEEFDMVLASGVLYHSTDPLRLLELISAVTDRIALWTHYYDLEAIANTPGIDRHFAPEAITTDFHGAKVVLHRRDYLEAVHWPGFCGGPRTHALWLDRDSLLVALEQLGFSDQRVGEDNRTHPNGPSILIYAARL